MARILRKRSPLIRSVDGAAGFVSDIRSVPRKLSLRELVAAVLSRGSAEW